MSQFAMTQGFMFHKWKHGNSLWEKRFSTITRNTKTFDFIWFTLYKLSKV